MTFVAETGAGLADATSYLSVVDFKTISDVFEYDYSALSDATIEARLMRATIILDSEYRSMFPGTRQLDTQALEWPRSNAVYVDGAEIPESTVPSEIENALVELFHVMGTSTAQPTLEPSGTLIYNRQRVEGAVEQEQRFQAATMNRRDIYMTVVDALSRITGGMSGYYDLRIIRVGG